jgi:aspartate/methionine/tyrosine aminotransferase
VRNRIATRGTGRSLLTSPIYRPSPRLARAALEDYAPVYGTSVLELDRSLGASPGRADMIDLTHGDTRAFEPPPAAAEDLAAAVADNTEAYTPYRGSTTVRNLLAPRLERLLVRAVDPERDLIITPGTQGGLFAALSALVSPDDVVALPDPDYFMTERIAAYLGARPHRVALHQDGDGVLRIDSADLEAAAAKRPKILVLSHPNNPTGGVYEPETAQALADLVIRGDMFAVVDQLYCRLLFDKGDYVHLGSLPGMAERTVTLLGPSKSESMSGYRVGVAVGPPAVIDGMERVVSLAALRTAGYAQQVLRHWMDDDDEWMDQRIAAHQYLRDRLIARLKAVPGMVVAAPAASSYVFSDASRTPRAGWLASAALQADDYALAVAMKAGGVLISPGYQFGPAGRGHFRINFSQDAGRLDTAADRISATLGSREGVESGDVSP